MSESTTSTPPMRSRNRSTNRRLVMAQGADQPGPAKRRASAALPTARGAGSIAEGSMETALPAPLVSALDSLDSCALFGGDPPAAGAASGRNGRGGANRKP